MGWCLGEPSWKVCGRPIPAPSSVRSWRSLLRLPRRVLEQRRRERVVVVEWKNRTAFSPAVNISVGDELELDLENPRRLLLRVDRNDAVCRPATASNDENALRIQLDPKPRSFHRERKATAANLGLHRNG